MQCSNLNITFHSWLITFPVPLSARKRTSKSLTIITPYTISLRLHITYESFIFPSPAFNDDANNNCTHFSSSSMSPQHNQRVKDLQTLDHVSLFLEFQVCVGNSVRLQRPRGKGCKRGGDETYRGAGRWWEGGGQVQAWGVEAG